MTKTMRQDYSDLRNKVQTGKDPHARLDIFCVGVAGVLEAHKDDGAAIAEFASQLKAENAEWNRSILTPAM